MSRSRTSRHERRRTSGRGFTLLEVMVAVAILGLGLTAILSAQAGAFSSAAHARNVSVATGLARCKMTEIEEHLLRDGMQEMDENDSGPCCADLASPPFACSWTIEKPEFPEPALGQLDLSTDGLGGPGGPDLGAIGMLAGGSAGQAADLFSPGSSPGDVAQTLAGAAGGEGAAGMMGGIASMVMGMVYPNLKSIFEQSARRVTMRLAWHEGGREHVIELMQWVVHPQRAIPQGMPDLGALMGEALGGDGATAPSTGPSPSPTPGPSTGRTR